MIVGKEDMNVVGEIDRKTHKRDIHEHRWHYERDDREVTATVEEITKPLPTTEAVETTTAQTEIITGSTTIVPETATVTTDTTIGTTIGTTTTTFGTTETTTESPPLFLPPTFEFTPTHTFYYGGQPNENANQIYITTSDPEQSTETMPSIVRSSPILFHNSIENRSDQNEFRPSVQYEYRNYRFDVDEHFVPIVGPQQIF